MNEHRTSNVQLRTSNKIRRAILLLILLLAAALRFHDITRHSLWLDELFSIQASAGHGLEHQLLVERGIVPDPPDLLSLEHAAPAWRVMRALARDDNHP